MIIGTDDENHANCEESMHDGHLYYTIKIHNGYLIRYCKFVLLE